MSGRPVLQSPFEYRLWKSLDGKAYPKGGPRALVSELEAHRGTVCSAVLVMLLDALDGAGGADRETMARVVDRSRAVDCMPSVRASEILLARGDPDGAEAMLAMSAGSGEVVRRSLAEARIKMARGDAAGARDAALRSYGGDPRCVDAYRILEAADPEGGWPQRMAIAGILAGGTADAPSGGGRMDELVAIYRDWFSGRRAAATDRMVNSVHYARRDPEFLLASARMSVDERDWRSASMVYSELISKGCRPFVYAEAARAAMGLGDADRALDLLSNADHHTADVQRDVVRARMLVGDRAEMMDAVRSLLDLEGSGSGEYVEMIRFLLSRGLDSEAGALIDRYSRFVGDDADALTLRSVLLMRSGDYPSAWVDAARAVRMSSGSSAPRAQLARVLFLMDRTEAATKECDRILEADPSNLDALGLMRDLHMSEGDHARAAEVCGRILEADPGDTTTRLALAECTGRLGDTGRAADMFSSILREDGSRQRAVGVVSSMISCGMHREAIAACANLERQFPREPMLKRLRGNAEYALGEYLKASVSFADAAAMDPHNPVLWHSKGMADEARGDLESAEDAYNRAVLLDQDEPEYWVSKAAVQERSKDRYGAVQSLNRAIELDPSSYAPLVRKSYILAASNRPEEALYFLRQARVRAPDSPGIAMAEGSILSQTGDLAGAEDAYRRVLASGPDEEASIRLARVLVSRGDRDGAARVISEASVAFPDSARLMDEASRVSSGIGPRPDPVPEPEPQLERPREDPAALAAMASSLLEAGDVRGAMRSVDRALRADPGDPDLCCLKSRIALAGGDAVGAGFLAESGLTSSPSHAGLHLALSESRLARGDLDGALTEVDRAISLGRDDFDSNCVKARVLERKGQPERAAACYSKALSLEPDNMAIAERLARMQAASGNLQGARSTLSRIMRRDQDRTSAMVLAAEVASSAGDRDSALAAFQAMARCREVPAEDKVAMVRILEGMGLRDEARALMEGAPVHGYDESVKRYAEKALRRAYTTRTSFDDPDILDAIGLDEDTAKEVSSYLAEPAEPGLMGPDRPDFDAMERRSHDVIVKLNWTDLEGSPLLPLERVFVAGGFREADPAKELVAYVHKAMFSPPGRDPRLSAIADGLPKGTTVFEIIRDCDLGVYEANAVRSMILRSVVPHLGLHELAHEAGGVVPLGEGERDAV